MNTLHERMAAVWDRFTNRRQGQQWKGQGGEGGGGGVVNFLAQYRADASVLLVVTASASVDLIRYFASHHLPLVAVVSVVTCDILSMFVG